MRRIISLLTALCLILSCAACGASASASTSTGTGNSADFSIASSAGADSAAPLSEAAEEGFSDVPESAWYADVVLWCKENGVMTGTSENTFSPDDLMTRAMLATVLWQAEGKPDAESTVEFSDVPAGSWYAEAVNWAASRGLMNGYDAETFGPEDPVPREQLAVVLWHCAGSPEAALLAVSLLCIRMRRTSLPGPWMPLSGQGPAGSSAGKTAVALTPKAMPQERRRQWFCTTISGRALKSLRLHSRPQVRRMQRYWWHTSPAPTPPREWQSRLQTA